MKQENKLKKSQFDRFSIKRRDIRNLLRAYSGAIALDQFNVDALPKKHFHAYYRRELWFHWRQCNVDFINKLLATTGALPSKLLSSLTVLAARRDPIVVRKTMVVMLATGASGSLVPGQIDTETLFFRALPAPGLFAITNGWPRSSLSFLPMIRASTSLWPPGVNATTPAAWDASASWARFCCSVRLCYISTISGTHKSGDSAPRHLRRAPDFLKNPSAFGAPRRVPCCLRPQVAERCS
jgi:hypothetical protein